MAISFYNHQRLYQRDKPAIDAAIARVIASGRFDWGDEVPAFEREFADWNGASHAVSVASGTAALKVALLALGIGPGDEVITVANTDIGSSSSIHHTGATPIWVDIEPRSRNIDVEALRRAITPRTRAILPVDLYGHPANMPAIMAIAAEPVSRWWKMPAWRWAPASAASGSGLSLISPASALPPPSIWAALAAAARR